MTERAPSPIDDLRVSQAIHPRGERPLLLAILVTALVVIAGTVAIYGALRRFQFDERWTIHTHEVLSSIERTMSLGVAAGSASRGYVITGDEGYVLVFDDTRQALFPLLDELGRLISDNPVQVENLKALRLAVQKRIQFSELTIAARRHQGFDGARRLIDSLAGKTPDDAIRESALTMELEERRLLESRLAESSRSYQMALAATMVNGMILLGVIGGLAYFIRRAFVEERKRVEMLAEVDEAKTVFFSNISHEFRTPLTLILAPLESLANELLGASERKHVDLAYRNALRLQKMVNALLDYSSAEAGRLRLNFTPTDLATRTAVLASMFSSVAQRAGLRLIVDCPPLPVPIYIDADKWEKIVFNLVSNAIKFTPQGTISVRLRWVDGCAVLTVADTGTGVPPEELPHLFDRFHRVPNALGRTHEGSGLGLALVQEFVNLHGGSIQVESTLGKGTVFKITLRSGTAHLPANLIGKDDMAPAAIANARAYVEDARLGHGDADEPAQGSEGSAAALVINRSRPLILLADDNADMRTYVRGLLEPYWDVKTVANGELAFDAATKEAPDLILSDMMMPKLDGYGLLHALRNNPRTKAIPVILLSAQASEEARVEGLKAGADDYLVKPFSVNELLARINTHLGIARIRHEAVTQAQHDPLTGLPNRKLAYEFAEHLLNSAKRAQERIALLFIDMDRFKPINDTYGHEAGDAVLKEVARRIKRCVRGEDTAGRLGGDEFLVVLSHVKSAADAAHAAQHLVFALSQPFQFGELVLHSTPSIGISLYPDDGGDIERLLHHADIAMYHAKEHGRGRYELYTEALNSHAKRLLHIESRLRSGLENGEFQLHYQPIVDVATNAVIGAEALVRWPSMTVGPDEFIPVAETSGMISALGNWGLNEACRQARQWLDQGMSALTMSVNVSPLQFRRQGFSAQVQEALQKHRIPPQSLQLELTETALLKNAEEVMSIMQEIKRLGVRFALDDFGQGYSSLSRLEQLPFDTLKVDRAFVHRLGEGEHASVAITDAIIGISKALKLQVVAEGVETSEVQLSLMERGCPQIQGFYISPPLTAKGFEAWYWQRMAA